MSCSTFCAIFSILSFTDWEIFESSFKTPHNLKAIALRDAPVDTVLVMLSGSVKEVELELHGRVC